MSEEKKVPNPYGKLGGPEHRKKVEEVGKEVRARNLFAVFEWAIELLTGKKRYVDVAGVDEFDNVKELHQIGKQTKKHLPVKRERDALEDIEKSKGMKPEFHPYNDVE
jgi:hypothetical protein